MSAALPQPSPASAIPAYLAAFPRHMATLGLRVEPITLRPFLDHHARCDYPPFAGWAESSDRILWGIWYGGEMIATWACRAYPMLPWETLRSLMEGPGLYADDREAMRLEGDAAAAAQKVRELAVFEGGLCIPTEWRRTPQAEAIVAEMGLFARASAVDHWITPWVFFLVKKQKLGERFAAEGLHERVIWTRDGELKDGVTRRLGLSSAGWIEARAKDWLQAHPR